jgi:cell division protein FtsL
MTRLNALVLLLALLASSLYLVNVSYDARRLFSELDSARAEERKLQAEFKRLDAERQAQATNLRVDKVARDRLGMRTATPAVTQFVGDPGVSTLPVGGLR